jgi:hypothetical protein
MADSIVKLDGELRALDHKLEQWEVGCRPNVADELAATELARVRAENSRGGIPLVTETALEHFEDEWRRQYDGARGAEATTLEVETTILHEAISEAITAAQTLPSERALHGTTTEKALLAALLDEQIKSNLTRVFPTMTATDLEAQYASWTDEADRSAVRLVEAAVLGGVLERFGLKADADPMRDGLALQRLQRAVSDRRKARVPAALYEQQARLAQLWTLPRKFLRGHFKEGRGIARGARV